MARGQGGRDSGEVAGIVSEIKADFLIAFLRRLGFMFFTVEPKIEEGQVTKYEIRISILAKDVDKLQK